MTHEAYELAIIGSGPVGLEAAARAANQGRSTILIDAGRLAAHVEAWGFVRLFSPFGMNVGPAGGARLQEAGVALPAEDELVTGRAFRERYLLPVARSLGEGVTVREHARVTDISRGRWLKGEALGSPERAEEPFRLLLDLDGAEEEVFANAVFDCTGVYGSPNWAGPGGTPARGERGVRAEIAYHIPDVLGTDRARYAGHRTLLLGSGHSAATTVLALADLQRESTDTHVTWATRHGGRPLEPIEGDPLPERAALIDRANAWAATPPEGSEWRASARLLAVSRDGDGFEVELEVDGVATVERFDHVVAHVGYEPDDGAYRQLQVHECYASRGPMKLAAALLAASGDGPVDCLDQGGFGPEALQNPEPGFFILGAKSFGKNSAFLMQTGYDQVADAFELLAQEPASV